MVRAATVWLLTLAIVAAVTAVELMAKIADPAAARTGCGLMRSSGAAEPSAVA